MGRLPNVRSPELKAAMADLIANPNQTLRQVAIRHGVMISTIRKNVYNSHIAYKRERGKGAGNMPPKPPPPEHEDTKIHRMVSEVNLMRERASGPPDQRMRDQLTNRFNTLAALWGDWVKK